MVETPVGLFEDLPEQERVAPGPGRLPRLREAERDQVELRSLSFDDLVGADHRVRLVWAFCDTLDLGPLLAAIRSVEGRPGHPAADLRILMALWLFATVEGVGIARALARLASPGARPSAGTRCAGSDRGRDRSLGFRTAGTSALGDTASAAVGRAHRD